MMIKQGQTILFTGDSITDCARARPVGTMPYGLGDGYVSLVHALLYAHDPACRLTVFNTGLSGQRITDLEARAQDDVLAHQPDWLSVMIGINDVWRQFDQAHVKDQVGAERFASTYRRLLDRVRPGLKGLVLMSPYYLETNTADPMRAMMDTYGGLVRQLAKEFDAIFVDTQATFSRYLMHQPTQSLCGDRIHPNRIGHMLLARAFLNAVGFLWKPD